MFSSCVMHQNNLWFQAKVDECRNYKKKKKKAATTMWSIIRRRRFALTDIILGVAASFSRSHRKFCPCLWSDALEFVGQNFPRGPGWERGRIGHNHKQQEATKAERNSSLLRVSYIYLLMACFACKGCLKLITFKRCFVFFWVRFAIVSANQRQSELVHPDTALAGGPSRLWGARWATGMGWAGWAARDVMTHVMFKLARPARRDPPVHRRIHH